MRPPRSGSNRIAVVSASVAHALAWAAFLGIVLWPCTYRGATSAPVNPHEAATPVMETVQHCVSFVEVNGLAVLVPLSLPVLLTAGILLIVLTGSEWRIVSTVALWLLAVSLLAFCVLGSASIGVLYLPAALASIVAAASCAKRRVS